MPATQDPAQADLDASTDNWYLVLAMRFFLQILIAVLMLAAPASADEFAYPDRTGFVNDYAAILPSELEGRLEKLCIEVLQKCDATIAVAIVSSLKGQSVEEYATGLYANWGVGEAGEDQGVLLLLAVRDRKVRIEVGYGLEGLLNDGKVGAILDSYVVPSLRSDAWEDGVTRGVAALSQEIAGDAGVELDGRIALPRRQSQAGIPVGMIIFFIILVVVIARVNSRGGGSGWGSGPKLGGGPWVGGSPYRRRHRGGGFGGFGGGGGGGFGGFGGGMSGGGGASRGF